MVERVISGGQDGADIAALRAADHLGIETGGWAPKGFRTKHGLDESLRTLYGLQEHESPNYPPRTFANVRDSDATLRIALNFESPGERCTLKAIKKFQKPYLDVGFEWASGIPGQWVTSVPVEEARAWLREHRVRVLNVAGNANSILETLAFKYVYRLLGGS